MQYIHCTYSEREKVFIINAPLGFTSFFLRTGFMHKYAHIYTEIDLNLPGTFVQRLAKAHQPKANQQNRNWARIPAEKSDGKCLVYMRFSKWYTLQDRNLLVFGSVAILLLLSIWLMRFWVFTISLLSRFTERTYIYMLPFLSDLKKFRSFVLCSTTVLLVFFHSCLFSL